MADFAGEIPWAKIMRRAAEAKPEWSPDIITNMPFSQLMAWLTPTRFTGADAFQFLQERAAKTKKLQGESSDEYSPREDSEEAECEAENECDDVRAGADTDGP